MRQHAIIDPETKRAERLERFWRHFEVQRRYGLTFKEFVAKVDAGTWVAYKAPEVS